MSPDGPGPRIRQAGPADWRALRDLRIEMLADTPLAYLETSADAARRSDEDWQERARRHTAPGSAVFVAEAPDGVAVGTMAVFVAPPGVPTVVSVYVAPAHRATGVADALLAACEAWAAATTTAEQVRLEVHEDNPRAQAFYRRHGYRLTGEWTPYALDTSQRDLEMVKPLRG